MTQLLPTTSDDFADRVVTWFEQHGRHHLAWQQHHRPIPNPYPVWLSEVMLQQTQVSTVIPYFERFIKSFPTVQDLANAEWDNVAQHWAGLGYYARARNLHKGAKQLVEILDKTGNFPQTVDEWQNISGVGQSTAGAIVAMGVRGFGVICDGNVKRVLTRWAGIGDDINLSQTNKKLWQLAEQLTPKHNSGHYAQAMMDIGATICTKSKPACLLCPIQADCVANQAGNPTAYPVKSKKSPNPSKFSLAVYLTDENADTLWLQRPDTGIWGGLYCLPLLFVKKEQKGKILEDWQTSFDKEYVFFEQIIFEFLQKNALLSIESVDKYFAQSIKHSLTHFHWYLAPIKIVLTNEQKQVLMTKLASQDLDFQPVWVDEQSLKQLAIPTAMQKLQKITKTPSLLTVF